MHKHPAPLLTSKLILAAGLAGRLLGPAELRAATLDLPVWTPGSGVRAPCYRGDLLEVQLTATSARLVLPRGAGPPRAVSRPRLGVPSLDAAAAAVGGVGFEPEF